MPWEVADSFRIRFGGNIVVNCGSLVTFNDEPLIRLRRRGDGFLGVDVDVRDPAGTRVATVRNGKVVQGDDRNYEILTSPDEHRVVALDTGRIAVRVARKDVEGAELDLSVRLYLPTGHLFEADPDSTMLGTLGFVDCEFRRQEVVYQINGTRSAVFDIPLRDLGPP